MDFEQSNPINTYQNRQDTTSMYDRGSKIDPTITKKIQVAKSKPKLKLKCIVKCKASDQSARTIRSMRNNKWLKIIQGVIPHLHGNIRPPTAVDNGTRYSFFLRTNKELRQTQEQAASSTVDVITIDDSGSEDILDTSKNTLEDEIICIDSDEEEDEYNNDDQALSLRYEPCRQQSSRIVEDFKKRTRRYYCAYCPQDFCTHEIRLHHMSKCNSKDKYRSELFVVRCKRIQRPNLLGLRKLNSSILKRNSDSHAVTHDTISRPESTAEITLTRTPSVTSSVEAVDQPFHYPTSSRPTEPHPVALVYPTQNGLSNIRTC